MSFLVVQKDKGAVPGLKRTLSEGNGDNEKDGAEAKSDTKRPKMQNEELEAKLELKITAKAGAHPKLEKVRPPERLRFSAKDCEYFSFIRPDFLSQIVQKLVDEHLRALELAFFDQPFKELKDRIDKIDCAAKHQTAVNTLQVSPCCGQVHARCVHGRMGGAVWSRWVDYCCPR